MSHRRPYLTDEHIAQMKPKERRELIERLSIAHVQLPLSARRLQFARRLRLSLMAGGSIVLVPWIIYLAFSLPKNYEANHWRVDWVGFDVLLLTFMVLTAWLGWKKRQLVLLTSFTTGILLICDAWFDIGTAAPKDVLISLASAIFLELPIAFLLIVGALRALSFMARATGRIEVDQNLWHAEIFLTHQHSPNE